jgi:hypothetical protein
MDEARMSPAKPDDIGTALIDIDFEHRHRTSTSNIDIATSREQRNAA